MKIAIAQIAPVFLDRVRTIEKVADWVRRAGESGARLVAFGETLIPAYPLWLARTDAARFDAPDQKELHALYVDQAVDLAEGHLAPIGDAARRHRVSVVLGVAERTRKRGSTVFCSRVIIAGDDSVDGPAGSILSVHRKLTPTYEERLSWGMGDGAGLVTHRMGTFTLGALNCWENWMPLARAALYGRGMDLHVMLWPGSVGLTRDITRFAAREGRSYVLSASNVVRESDIPRHIPHRARFCRDGETLYDGGSCIAGPDGSWIVEPVIGREELIVAELDPRQIAGERQNFDPAGHYARADVLRLSVDRRRHRAVEDA